MSAGSQINVNSLADAIRNAAGNTATYESRDLGIEPDVARKLIGRFMDQPMPQPTRISRRMRTHVSCSERRCEAQRGPHQGLGDGVRGDQDQH